MKVPAIFNSMSGRIFAILLIGVTISATLALSLAEMKHGYDMVRLREQRLADRVSEFVTYYVPAPPEMRTQMLEGATRGIHSDHTGARGTGRDEAVTRRLRERLGASAQAVAEHTPISTCLSVPEFTGSNLVQRRPSPPDLKPAQCWLVTMVLKDGAPLKIAIDTYPLPFETGRTLDPIFLMAIAAAAALLALPVARMAVKPMDELAHAAAELGPDLNSAPMRETGPKEVRAAAQAFNAMQRRLQSHVRERTEMLAAITHDLQTPITRMRLRLEKVADPVLHDRLVGDLAAMQAMVREGLDLARSVDSTEPRVVLDLDSMLEGLVEDAADAGHPVEFLGGCGADIWSRPQSIRRCLSNLLDNAIKYGGEAQVSATRVGDKAMVWIKDNGPGIPEDQLEAVFQPFARLETSRSRETGGVGLGLTIARNLAEREGAALTLRNHPRGGVEAVLAYPVMLRTAEPAKEPAESPAARGGAFEAARRRARPRKPALNPRPVSGRSA